MRDALILIACAILIFLLLRKVKNAPPPQPGERIILKRGSTGEDVKHLQRKLNTLIQTAAATPVYLDGNTAIPVNNVLDVDGMFGIATEMALLAFTGTNSIYADSIEGIQFIANRYVEPTAF